MNIFHHFTMYYCIIFYTLYYNQFKKLAPNVSAVYDVFLRPIRKNAEHFYGRKKMWLRNTLQRAQARLVYCVARAAEGGEAYTDLLRLQKKYFLCYFFVLENNFLFICYFFISFIVIFFFFYHIIHLIPRFMPYSSFSLPCFLSLYTSLCYAPRNTTAIGCSLSPASLT